MDPASSERSRSQKPRMIGTPVFSDRTEFSVTTGWRIRTRKRDHPSRRAESAAAVYAVAPGQFF
jgi:hypothetical protein